jgi:hypothetical protein
MVFWGVERWDRVFNFRMVREGFEKPSHKIKEAA